MKGLESFELTPAGRDALEETTDFPRPMGATPRRRKNAVDEDTLNAEACGEDGAPSCLCEEVGRDDCPVHGPNSDTALDAAIAGNASVFDSLNRELIARSAELSDKSALVHELQAQVTEYRRMALGCKQERDNVIANHAELIEQKLRLEVRLSRLTELGTPAPASIDEAIEQLFDAEAVYAGAEEDARMARCAKFDAQIARDLFEQQAIESLMQSLPAKKTEAKERLLEHPRYLELEEAFRAAARTSDELETTLRVAASRVETLRVCLRAMTNRSPLTSRAAAISNHARTQQ